MAVSYIDSSTAHSSSSVSSQKITLPSTIQANDDVIVIATATADVGWTTPAGYSIEGAIHTRGTSLGSVIYRKTAVGGDAGAVVTVNPDQSQRISVIALVLRGSNGDDVTAAVSDGNNSSIVCPTVTTVTDGDLIIRVGTQRIPTGATSDTWTDPGGYIRRAQSFSTFSSNANAAAVAYTATQSTHGSTGTVTIGSQYSGVWISYTVAIKPSAGSPLSVSLSEPITVQEQIDFSTPPHHGPVPPAETIGLGDDSIRTLTYIKRPNETIIVGERVDVSTVVPPGPNPDIAARFLLGPSAQARTREIALPFRIDTVRGRIAIAQDPVEQLAHHVLSVLGTNVGERAMRPAYGSTLVASQFGPASDPLLLAELRDSVSRALSLSCPEVKLVKVEVIPNEDSEAEQSSFVVNVHFEPASGGALTVASLQVGVFQPSGTVRDTGF